MTTLLHVAELTKDDGFEQKAKLVDTTKGHENLHA